MDIIGCRFQEVINQQKSTWRELVIFTERELEVLKQFCSLSWAWVYCLEKQFRRKEKWQEKQVEHGLGETKKVREPIEFVLMLPIHNTRFRYHDLIGQIANCWHVSYEYPWKIPTCVGMLLKPILSTPNPETTSSRLPWKLGHYCQSFLGTNVFSCW